MVKNILVANVSLRIVHAHIGLGVAASNAYIHQIDKELMSDEPIILAY